MECMCGCQEMAALFELSDLGVQLLYRCKFVEVNPVRFIGFIQTLLCRYLFLPGYVKRFRPSSIGTNMLVLKVIQ
jgi:hypothetical protein